MRNKLTETRLKPSISRTRHLISGVLCLAVISLICARASAQNLFVSDFDCLGNGIIDEFTPNGVRNTFASGLNDPAGLAFDKAGKPELDIASSSDTPSFLLSRQINREPRLSFLIGISETQKQRSTRK